jgi:hypothetical protein
MSQLPDPLEWLAAGVPLTLLLDVLGSTPPSAELYRDEPGDAAWLRPAPRAA